MNGHIVFFWFSPLTLKTRGVLCVGISQNLHSVHDQKSFQGIFVPWVHLGCSMALNIIFTAGVINELGIIIKRAFSRIFHNHKFVSCNNCIFLRNKNCYSLKSFKYDENAPSGFYILYLEPRKPLQVISKCISQHVSNITP